MTLHPGKCNIPPPKTALFGERTLGKATALRAAPAAAEKGEVLRLTLARFLISRRKTRGKPQRSVSGLPLTRRRKVLCADIVRILKCFIARHFHSAPIFNGGVSPASNKNRKGPNSRKLSEPHIILTIEANLSPIHAKTFSRADFARKSRAKVRDGAIKFLGMTRSAGRSTPDCALK